jgi:hypothetical protein
MAPGCSAPSCRAPTTGIACKHEPPQVNGTVLDISLEQVAAAEFVGVEFLPASADQVHRLSMQRKVFRIDGEAVLATRDGSFFETAATLGQLIEEGEQRRRDLTEWEAASPTAVPAPEEPEPPPGRASQSDDETAPSEPELPTTSPNVPVKAEATGRQPRPPRWFTAGAERQGRASQHWSVRPKSRQDPKRDD